MTELYSIDIWYACFNIDITDGVCTDTAPIAKWMKGKTLQEILEWADKRKAKVENLGDVNKIIEQVNESRNASKVY